MDNCVIKPADESRNAYAAYQYCLRNMVKELRELATKERGNDTVMADDILRILDRHHATEFEADGILRLGLEFPKDIVAEFQAYWTARGGQV